MSLYLHTQNKGYQAVLGSSIKFGSVVQLVRMPPCHGGGREFKSRRGRQWYIPHFESAKCGMFAFGRIVAAGMTTTIDPQTLSDAALDALFREARTANSFTDEPVPAATLRTVYELAKFGPTAANTQPLRIVYLTTREAKERLSPLMSEGNRAKTLSAPVNAILAADVDFNVHMPKIFPHAPGAQDWFGDADQRREVASFNAGLQIGYFILAARSQGLAVGPMNGFDKEAVDAEFLAGTNHASLVVANLGQPGVDPWFDRLPRHAFEDAVTVL